ncbi:MAG: hypothetical protein FJ221_00185 [Lentisphaerae bacterium]|nr:hypothetical protein [Lentisphaerota bacterium]
MSPALPVRIAAASALLAGAAYSVAADSVEASDRDAGAKIVVRRDADEPATPATDAAAEKAEPAARSDRVRDPAAPGGPGRPQGSGTWTEGARPVDRLLEYVKRNHPDEYERLVTLRREDPEAFQQALRRRFEEASTRFREPGGDPRRTNVWRKTEGGDAPRPPFAGPAEVRPPMTTDRADGAKRPGPAGEKSDRPAAPKAPGKAAGTEAALSEHMASVKGLVDQYHHAKGEPKEQLRRRIREQVGQTYELRERDRAARIRQMEEELARLKKEIESRREFRDQIIDRKVAEVLGEDPTVW